MFDKEMVSTASVHSVNNITKWQITQVARTLAITKASCARQLYISERVYAKLLSTFQPKEHAKKKQTANRTGILQNAQSLFSYFTGYQGYGGHLFAANETQSFTNPYGPSGYQNNMHVTWWISSHSPDLAIELKFTFLDLEPPCFDYLEFYTEGRFILLRYVCSV